MGYGNIGLLTDIGIAVLIIALLSGVIPVGYMDELKEQYKEREQERLERQLEYR